MTRGPENLRLLLFAKETNNVNSTCPTLYRRNCLMFSVIQIFFLITFFLILAFIAIRVVDIQKDIKKKENETPENIIPGCDFCKMVNAENMSLMALGYLTGIREENYAIEGRNMVYYVTDRMYTDQEACAVEALLRLLQDKTVFVIEISNLTSENSSNTDYLEFLREHYTNLNRMKSTPDKFFKGSPFQNYLKTVNEFSIFAAKVLIVWQFGGTVVSPNFLLLSRRLYDNNEGFCEVDKELLFCPNQCCAYVYQLVKTILDMLRKSSSQKLSEETLENIVDKSVADYCGNNETIAIGCVGINRIKTHSICQELKRDCDFLQMQQWKLNNGDWKNTVQKFCPKIVTRFMPSANN